MKLLLLIACTLMVKGQLFDRFQPKPIKDIRGGSKLSVTHPPDLIDLIGSQGNLKSSLGNFGHIQYGTTIVGRLDYDPNNFQGCKSFNSSFAS